MTKPFKTLLVALFAIMLSSCGASYKAMVKNFDPVNLSVVKLDMTKAEVQTALGRNPDNTILAERDPDNNLIEVVQYSQTGSVGADVNKTFIKVDSYWLYFVNDKLYRWHQIKPDDKRPMDYYRSAGR